MVAECWPTINRAGANSKWEQYSYEQPYDHAYPFQAELHLSAAPGHTAFRSPFDGQDVFVLPAADGRIDVYPGGVRHSSAHWAESTPRVSLRFNFDIRSRVECRIPLVMSWCQKQERSHLSTVLTKEKVDEMAGDVSYQVLDVDHRSVAKLYDGSAPKVL